MTFETLRWHADTHSHGFYNLFALCYLCGADLSTGCELHDYRVLSNRSLLFAFFQRFQRR